MDKAEFYQKLKVLVVDDHRIMRTLVRQHLQSLGVLDVETAANGEDALDAVNLAYAQKTPYDIVFLDWQMPGMSGIDVLKQCRANPKHGGTAFVMLTAEQEEKNILEAIQNGATSYMVKPVSNDTVSKNLDKVTDWLQKNNITFV